MLTLKEEKTKAAQGRKNKKGSKKGDMDEVRAVNKPGLVQNDGIHSVVTLWLRTLWFPQMFVDDLQSVYLISVLPSGDPREMAG